MRHAYRTALALVAASVLAASEPPGRGILVCVAADAPPAIRAEADALAREHARVPLLVALRATQGAAEPEVVVGAAVPADKDRAAWRRMALNHLVLVGLPSDPLLAKCWGYMTRIDTAAKRTWMLGYGHLGGDIGWVECDRNPFLHSQQIEHNDFDTAIVKLSGTSEAGVVAAVTAFRRGLANGLVAVGRPERPEATILDLDPLADPPPAAPERLATARWAGWTQCAGNEYRAFLDAGDAEPTRMWRLKWLQPKGWDAVGARGWLAGMSRLSFGSAANLAEFADPATATRMAEAIGRAGTPATLAGAAAAWQLAAPTDHAIDAGDAAPVLVAAKGRLLVMSTLDAAATAQLLEALP